MRGRIMDGWMERGQLIVLTNVPRLSPSTESRDLGSYLILKFSEDLLRPPVAADMAESFFLFPSDPKIFQNLRVSSAAREHTREPSGEVAMWSTREVCPLSSLVRAMVGYFQSTRLFSAYP